MLVQPQQRQEEAVEEKEQEKDLVVAHTQSRSPHDLSPSSSSSSPSLLSPSSSHHCPRGVCSHLQYHHHHHHLSRVSALVPPPSQASSTSAPASKVRVNSPNVSYTEDTITSRWSYHTTSVEETPTGWIATPKEETVMIRTASKVPRTGVMLVGWGGNNGSTLTAALLANQKGLTWETRTGRVSANFLGSITQASTVRLGQKANGEAVHVLMKDMLPMVDPCDLVVSGWDISSMNLADAMDRAAVLEPTLKEQLRPLMKDLVPLPSIYIPDYIAANQENRADNILSGSRQHYLETIRRDIADFKATNSLDKVVVLWTATTERFSEVAVGLNDTAESLLHSIRTDAAEVSPSTIFAVASILEGCSYINGSPQNSLVPGVVELAKTHGVFVGGDDFKSGQTKMKSVLVDFLVGAGIKPTSIVSYNHLGNNDGKNLSAPQQFRSKEISKRNVVDDVVSSNPYMYPSEKAHPDHVVVIKYVPAVGDSKRAMDEYCSEIFMGGTSTIAIHNTCEDSLLAAPLILDLIILTELLERITFATKDSNNVPEHLDSVLSILGYLLKAPQVPEGTPVLHALFPQRAAIVNLLRACLGLSPESSLFLEHKLPSMLEQIRAQQSEELKATQALANGEGTVLLQ